MPILEDLKEYTERATGLKRPGKQEAPNLTRHAAMAADHLSGRSRSR